MSIDRRVEPPENACRTAEDSERRSLCRTLLYWMELRPDGLLPSLANVDAGAPPDLSPHLFIIGRDKDKRSYVLMRSGTVLRDLCGHDPVGLCATEALPPCMAERIPHLCDSVFNFAKPLSHSGNGFHEGREIAYRMVMLPLASDGDKVDHALASLSFRSL